ncbi:hypothetical protein L1887_11398 [Cichorium endivia]|nr:hypothetical protein L1887_11398 [Cichorium endivia]
MFARIRNPIDCRFPASASAFARRVHHLIPPPISLILGSASLLLSRRCLLGPPHFPIQVSLSSYLISFSFYKSDYLLRIYLKDVRPADAIMALMQIFLPASLLLPSW